MLTNEQLNAIRERTERATPGYWWVKYGIDESVEINVGHGFSARYVADVLRSNDGEFIANARNDVPMLLAEIERLQTELYYATRHERMGYDVNEKA
ncbi:hypothetical protein [Cytobacillus massiliigabonensis]|uniref:hypothetical protein n=1 Tax=Cytobacillus massiliigabonensis TaxID=1871011 RepID=UPI000C833AFA|nr:hypothetical protein [Cytobacillus massiliigabonensis]